MKMCEIIILTTSHLERLGHVFLHRVVLRLAEVCRRRILRRTRTWRTYRGGIRLRRRQIYALSLDLLVSNEQKGRTDGTGRTQWNETKHERPGRISHCVRIHDTTLLHTMTFQYIKYICNTCIPIIYALHIIYCSMRFCCGAQIGPLLDPSCNNETGC